MNLQQTYPAASASTFVLYSPNESAISDGAGFWNNQLGWVEFAQATVFTKAESEALPMPIATGHDAAMVPWEEANGSYGGM